VIASKALAQDRPDHGSKRRASALPTLEVEKALYAQGLSLIAGLDEAGRGALAGPVVAAAVILPIDRSDLEQVLTGVRDSKQVTAGGRELFFEVIQEAALAVGVGVSAPSVIDRDGILAATRQAMIKALARLSPQPACLIIDHLPLTTLSVPQLYYPKADALSLSVAAASIIAKVTRDRLMVVLDERYPGYGLASHKGYLTRMHLAALRERGPCRIHRLSFDPLKTMLPG
jgi:ribonuclease HII